MTGRARLAALLVAGTAGCGADLHARLPVIDKLIKEARDNGAYRCAPRELALAETHYEFTVDELYYGNYLGAKEDFAIASRNAQLAVASSPRERCLDKPRTVVIAPLDSDGDGVVDPDDKCPQVPGPADNAGCPWPDTDRDGVFDKEDRCPAVPGPRENAGCPWPDTDKDGVLDKDDKCPQVPGLPKYQGCPPPDRDGDGVLDAEDRCPDEPGPASNNGCPYKLITVTRDKIELKQKVFFDTDRAGIKPMSFAMLDEIADVLTKNSTLEVRIEGHTDSRAGLKHNMKLSQDRAAAVRRYLIDRGVDPTKMIAVGYGPTRPIDDNRTAMGREANRRVEFVITKQ